MLKLFRTVSLIEGMSYLLILCVTLGFISRDLVSTIGMGHGVLFIAYTVFSLLASRKQGWSVGVWLLVFLSAIVPFAFILVKMFLQKELLKEEDNIERTA